LNCRWVHNLMLLNPTQRALEIATDAHKGQSRKYSGDPYVTHPIAVAEIALENYDEFFQNSAFDFKSDVEVVALLHDVVEDSEWTIEDLEKEGFPESVTHAVDLLTKKDDDYASYIKNIKQSTIASLVKHSDITHNSRTAKGRDKLHKYALAKMFLDPKVRI